WGRPAAFSVIVVGSAVSNAESEYVASGVVDPASKVSKLPEASGSPFESKNCSRGYGITVPLGIGHLVSRECWCGCHCPSVPVTYPASRMTRFERQETLFYLAVVI